MTPVVDMTLRSALVPHYGGTALRVHLSNRLGLSTVTIGHASIGTRLQGAALVPGSTKPLSFGGKPAVSLPAGSDIVSDPLPFMVTQFRDLLTSLYIVSAPTPPTQHLTATQTGYLAPGNLSQTDTSTGFVAAPTAGAPVALPQNVSLVSGLDVLAPGDVGAVAAFGDSITDGFQGNLIGLIPSPDQVDKNTRYPDYLARRLAAAGRKLSVVNLGISGNQLLADATVPIFGPSGLHRQRADLLSQSGVTTVILLMGINDIGQSSATAPALLAGYRQFVAAAHASGVKVLLGTITPSGGAQPAAIGDLAEPTRQAVNAAIRKGGIADGVVDFDAAVRDPAHPGQLLPAYDGSDHLHFTAAGHEALASAVPLGLLADAACARVTAKPVATPSHSPGTNDPSSARPAGGLAATGGLPLALFALTCCLAAGALIRRRHPAAGRHGE